MNNFRCKEWDKEIKIIKTIETMYLKGSNSKLFIPNKKCPNKLKTHNFQFPPDELSFLMFTGITDKNGKDIYEGHILEIEDDYNNKIMGYVAFVNFEWVLKVLVNFSITKVITFKELNENYTFGIIENIFEK